MVQEVAGSIVEAMKGQPLLLALVIISFSLVGLLYYQSISFSAQRQANVMLIIETQKETQRLLSKCHLPLGESK
jgi:hypothetical protein